MITVEKIKAQAEVFMRDPGSSKSDQIKEIIISDSGLMLAIMLMELTYGLESSMAYLLALGYHLGRADMLEEMMMGEESTK